MPKPRPKQNGWSVKRRRLASDRPLTKRRPSRKKRSASGRPLKRSHSSSVRYQRDLADIKVKLQPFIADGYTYNEEDGPQRTGSHWPRCAAGVRWRPGRKGLEKLLYVGGTTTNDRERGAFPQYVGSEFAWRQLNKDFIVKAQDYLIKYGDLMVEEGLLAK